MFINSFIHRLNAPFRQRNQIAPRGELRIRRLKNISAERAENCRLPPIAYPIFTAGLAPRWVIIGTVFSPPPFDMFNSRQKIAR
jgi:hypothetical protein